MNLAGNPVEATQMYPDRPALRLDERRPRWVGGTTAPDSPGSRQFPILGDAPGSYVLDR